jgi:hypothetical protein
MANANSNKTSTPVEEIEDAVDEGVEEEVEAKPALEVLDAKLSDDEILADLPKLKPATHLRIRERNVLLALVMRADVTSKEAEGKDAFAEQMSALDLMSGIDDFAESIAFDKDAYVSWSEGQGHEAFLAILNRYSSALGK